MKTGNLTGFPHITKGNIEKVDIVKNDLKGQKFGRLIVKERIGSDKHKKIFWKCVCVCGNISNVSTGSLQSGHTKSCGCLRTEKTIKRSTTHGLSKNATYDSWRNMLRRCNNPNVHDYKNYGGRGIAVCDRWLSVENFFKDMGIKPEGLTIERIDNDLGYFKENCCWASHTTQSRNQRVQKNNTSGSVGVSWNKQRQKYQAAITVNGKSINLGRYKALIDAIEARKNGEQEYWE